jgi:hypothetical protein
MAMEISSLVLLSRWAVHIPLLAQIHKQKKPPCRGPEIWAKFERLWVGGGMAGPDLTLQNKRNFNYN